MILLKVYGAKWHKTCRNNVGLWKYERQKRHATSSRNDPTETPRNVTRLSSVDAATQVDTKCLTTTQLLRWMLCGLEIARLVNEFEDSNIVSTAEYNYKHHEQTKSIKHTFQQQVNDLVSVIQDLGNPFADKSDDLLVLDTRDIVDPSVAREHKTLNRLGEAAI